MVRERGKKKKLKEREDIETEGTLEPLVDKNSSREERNEERPYSWKRTGCQKEEIGVVLWYTDTGLHLPDRLFSSCREKEIRREKRIRNSASYPLVYIC